MSSAVSHRPSVGIYGISGASPESAHEVVLNGNKGRKPLLQNLFRDGRHLWFSTRYEIAESIDAAIDGIGAVSKEIPKAIEFPQSLLVPKNCVILRAVF